MTCNRTPLHTLNHIQTAAPLNEVYRLAAAVEHWPQLLPHYRWVHVLRPDENGKGRLVEMAARRSGFPVRWTSIQTTDPMCRWIRYRHVAGVTRGMIVQWTFKPVDDGTEIQILHDVPTGESWITLPVVRYLVGTLFVMNIADKTLRGICRVAEGPVL